MAIVFSLAFLDRIHYKHAKYGTLSINVCALVGVPVFNLSTFRAVTFQKKPSAFLYLNLSYCEVIWSLANQSRTESWNLFQTGLVLPPQNCQLVCMQLFSSSSSHFDSTKELNPLKHGSSDGRVRDLRSKGQGFEPGLDPMRPASKCKHYYCLGRVMIQGCPLVVDTNWSSKKPGMKKYKNVA